MANDENKIILEFPATNVEIEFGETITFDNISGFLNSDRVTYNGESLTEEIAHLENDKADNTKIAPEYDEEETYYRGDIVLYNGVLYECDNTDASGEFSPSDWKEITLGEGIEDVRDLLANYYTKSQIDLHFLGKTNPSGTGYLSLNRRGSTGAYSVSVGRLNEASAQSSFAEGENNTSSGYAAHSEGYGNNASGLMAHAEGVTTESSGYGSHSEGVGTIANHIGQHVFGTYNVADTSTAEPTAKGNYIEIVGNGTDDDRRRNARTLDWRGNETLMGDLTFNGNKSLTSEISRLDGKIDNLPSPMIFKGTLGVGGTIQSLPDASASNEGYTYKVITDGTYAGQTAKGGDVFTSNGSAWVLIPSGDEDNDTWRAIKVEGVEVLGNGISSGAVDFVGSENIEVDFDSNGNKVGVKTKNIYTKKEVDDIIYNILPDDTASGSVANFETDLALPLKSLEVDVNAVQSGSGEPSPDNVRPISGWDKITVTRTGKNLLAKPISYYSARLVDLNECFFLKKGAYTLNLGTVSGATKWRLSMIIKDKNGNNLLDNAHKPNIGMQNATNRWRYGNDTNITTYTITAATDCYVRFCIELGDTTSSTTLSNSQLELGSTAIDYEPYNGNTEVINLGGTYYGGVLDVVRGKLRVLKQKKKLSDFAWTKNTLNTSETGRIWYISFANKSIKGGSDVLCDSFDKTNWGSWQSLNLYEFMVTDNYFVFCVEDNYATSADMLADYGDVEFTVSLKTPIEVQLTPQEIEAIVGTNNIYADTGDSAVEFKVSVEQYVSNHSGGSLGSSLRGGLLGSNPNTDESEGGER